MHLKGGPTVGLVLKQYLVLDGAASEVYAAAAVVVHQAIIELTGMDTATAACTLCSAVGACFFIHVYSIVS